MKISSSCSRKPALEVQFLSCQSSEALLLKKSWRQSLANSDQSNNSYIWTLSSAWAETILVEKFQITSWAFFTLIFISLLFFSGKFIEFLFLNYRKGDMTAKHQFSERITKTSWETRRFSSLVLERLVVSCWNRLLWWESVQVHPHSYNLFYDDFWYVNGC